MHSTSSAIKAPGSLRDGVRSKPRPAPVSVLIVDDSPMFRAGVESLFEFCNLNSSMRYVIVGQAISVEQALSLSREQSPNIVLLNTLLEGNCSLSFLTRQKQVSPHSRVLMIADEQEDERIFRAMQSGARGYLLKSKVPTNLLSAIATLTQEQIYLSPQLATAFFRGFHFYSGRSLQSKPCIHLTEREQEVLHWVVQGSSNIQISQELCITVGTVKAYLTTIFEKLEVKSRTQAALKALKLGLVCA